MTTTQNEFGSITLDPAPPVSEQGLTRGRRPEWLRVRAADSPKYRRRAQQRAAAFPISWFY